MLRILKKNKEPSSSSEKQAAVVLPLHAPNRSLEFLIELVEKIRPGNEKNINEAELRFRAVLYQLSQDRSSLFSLRKALLTQFLKTDIVPALTESGIVSSRGFVQELMSKLKHKFLPALQAHDDFLYVINRIFYRKTDRIWVTGIDKRLWIDFFELLGIQVNLTEPKVIRQLNEALQFLSYKVTSLGLEKEITSLFHSLSDAVFPFLEQNRLVNEYLQSVKNFGDTGNRQLILANINEALHNCNQSIQWIRDQRLQHGTSLAQAYILARLQQQVDRLFIILDVLDEDNNFNTERFVDYFTLVIKNENRKNSVRHFVSENTSYLAYQIAEHGGRRGERFITTTRAEFWKMFISACGGGIIMGFIGILKNLLSKLSFPYFWQGILYSTNYSLGFILIQDTGSTLATKQPAYTANNVASSLDTAKTGGEPDLRNLAITVARVSRTQLASFAGNLVFVFPVSYFLAALFFHIFGYKIIEGQAAYHLITDQHPFHSLAIFYACITGFFLFLSGIIAGYVENYVVYGKLTTRLSQSAVFKNNFPEKKRNRILNYIENSLGALAGSISLGFFLGMSSVLGKMLSIPFDVRHITISAANAAIGFYGIGHSMPLKEVIIIITGVLSIGFFNFAISFGMAFFVAVKSRGIHLKSYPEFLGILWRYFKSHPRDFIKAPSRRMPEELK